MKTSTIFLVIFAAVMVTMEFSVTTFAVELDGSENPHLNEDFLKCGNRCNEKTCLTIKLPEDLSCSKMCEVGYFCKEGYVRVYEGGPCISPANCGIFNMP